jgi:hypothetical protein
VIAVNLHPGNFARYSRSWGQHLISSTAHKHVPIYNAEQLLSFVEFRDAVRLSPPTPDGTRWKLGLSEALTDDLTLLLPERFGDTALTSLPHGPVFEIHGKRYRGAPVRGTVTLDVEYAPRFRR